MITKQELEELFFEFEEEGLEIKKNNLIAILKYIKEDCEEGIKALEEGEGDFGLFGSLQTTWNLYQQAGEYKRVLSMKKRLESFYKERNKVDCKK